jgi:hypothetical protein
MPSEVTPWFTALRAYSGSCQAHFENSNKICQESTYLDEFPTAKMLADNHQSSDILATDLGEKVVSEKEYLSAMA